MNEMTSVLAVLVFNDYSTTAFHENRGEDGEKRSLEHPVMGKSIMLKAPKFLYNPNGFPACIQKC